MESGWRRRKSTRRGPIYRLTALLIHCHRRAKWELQRKCAGLSLPKPVHLLSPPPVPLIFYCLSIVGTNLIYKQKATYNTFYSFRSIERVLDRVLHLKTDIHVVIQQYCHEFIKHSLENKAKHIFLFMETRCNSHNNLFRRLLLLSQGPMVRTRGPGSVPRVPRVLLTGASVPSPKLLHVVATCSGPLGLLVSCLSQRPSRSACGGF